ncbi:MAG: hybrid sensor histidine kinase/response regulator [Herminiimonas sp.]|nr:hybrid sensor histidine kinase/response regulator [Herminiimonas sp.]
MKIRAYIALCVLAILVPVILFSWVAMSDMQNSARDAAIRGLKETAHSTALIVDRELYSAETALKVLQSSAYLANGDYAGFYDQARTVNVGNTRWVVLLAESGQQLVNTRVSYGTALPPLTQQRADETRKQLDAGKTLISNLVPGTLDNSLRTEITVPVQTSGGKRYLLGIVFSTDHFRLAIADNGTPKDWVVAIIDGQGNFISRSLDPAKKIGTPARPELVAAARAQHSGEIQHPTLEGMESYDAFTRPSIGPWFVAVAAPVAGIQAAARRAASLALFGLGIALLFSTLVASVFARKLLKSIKRATASATLLGAGETPTYYHSGLIEVDQLHDSLARAATMLVAEKSRREAAETERQSLLASERAARSLAERQNKAKDDFLAMLGHELRNPLSAISASISLIKLAGSGSVQAERALQVIARQSGHLGRIVEDLLDTARMMAGKVVLSPTRIDLAAAVRAALEAQSNAGTLQHLTVEVTTKPTWVEADPTRIDQIVTNLLTNAGKYTPPGGRITIEVGAEAGNGVLSVADTGVGMEPALLSTVFEPFVQGQRPLDRAGGGLGIGLTMVKNLAELHGGSVHAESAGPSKGSRFTLTLPLTSAPELDPPRVDFKAPEFVAQHLRKRILLIEDNVDSRQMIAILLRIQGHEVIEAGTGGEGVRQALSAQPDIAIIDIGLPDMDGYEVARAIRASEAGLKIRLVALTGYGMAGDIERAMQAGFAEHITKPVNMESLLRGLVQPAVAS